MGEQTGPAPARRRSEWGLLLVVISLILAFYLLVWAAHVDQPAYPTSPRTGAGTFVLAGVVSCVPAAVAVVLSRGFVRVLAVLVVLAVLAFAGLAEAIIAGGGVRLTF